MTVAEDWQLECSEFLVEEIWTGAFASGFGQVGDGRSFSFRIEQQLLVVDVYRPLLECPVPMRRTWWRGRVAAWWTSTSATSGA